MESPKRGGHAHGAGDRKAGEQKKYTKFRKDNRCRFCRDKADGVDYKDVNVLIKLCTNQGKIYSRKRSGNCSRHQRLTTYAVKNARYMALLPYSGK